MPSPTELIAPSPEGWLRKVTDGFTGLNASRRPSAIEDSELIQADNVQILDGQIEVDKGYTTFGQTTLSTPQDGIEFIRADGTVELCLVTNGRFFKWNSTSMLWELVSNDTATTLSVSAVLGETSLTVASIVGFTAGAPIGIRLDDGTQHITTINGAPAGSTIVITTGLASAAASGNAVIESVALNGTDSIPVDSVIYPGTDWLVFTNGIDTPQRYDGSTVEDVPGILSGLSLSTFTARYVEVIEDYLMFFYTIEDGVTKGRRIRRCNTGDPTTWTGGNAGYDELLDTDDMIVGAKKLGIYMIVYKEQTIVRGEHLGQSGNIFRWRTTVNEAGANSNRSIVAVESEHYVFGPRSIYIYRGDFSIEQIDEKVFDALYAAEGSLSPSTKFRCFAVLVEETDEIWFFYPIAGATFPNRVLRYSMITKSWTARTFTEEFTGAVAWVKSSSLSWDAMTGTWDDHPEPWDSKFLQSNSPIILLLGYTSTQVFQYDFLQTTDNGSAIVWTIQTKDFMFGGNQIRTNRVFVYCKGSAVLLEYSKDRGATYTTIATLAPGSVYAIKRGFRQVVTEAIRFRLSGSGAPGGVEWLVFEYKQETTL